MINQWKVDNLKKTIEELEETIREKDNLILSENDMNNFLKTQNESLKITLDNLAQLNRKLTDKLAKERVANLNKQIRANDMLAKIQERQARVTDEYNQKLRARGEVSKRKSFI